MLFSREESYPLYQKWCDHELRWLLIKRFKIIKLINFTDLYWQIM
jgi:hypothetical protein